MTKWKVLAAGLFGFALAACGSSSSSPEPYRGFVQPANTVAVNFKADDSANRVFAAGELLWKGSMTYDTTTRKVTFDGNWTGGTSGHDWAPLYDDGPWDQLNATTNQPGHEPKGSVAGDHKWGVTVFASNVSTDPQYTTGLPQTFEYGLVDAAFGYGWIWKGGNGTFQVTSGATTELNAPGITFDAFGTTDMKLVIDTSNSGANLAPHTPPWALPVTLKGSVTTWVEVTLYDDGTHGDDVAADGKFTFVLSQYVGAGHQFFHSGLLKTGDQPEFVYVFNGVEYKDATGAASPMGVEGFVKAQGAATWTSVPITLTTGTFVNTRITVP